MYRHACSFMHLLGFVIRRNICLSLKITKKRGVSNQGTDAKKELWKQMERTKAGRRLNIWAGRETKEDMTRGEVRSAAAAKQKN